MSTIPEGWTDDMTIPLPQGKSWDDVVDVVLASARRLAPYEETIADLLALGLSADDSALAYDRSLGGVVRAATGNPANEPSPEKDPMAHASWARCQRDPGIVTDLRPRQAPAPKRLWWQFWKS